MYDVYMASQEDLTEPEDQTDIIARPLVQLMIGNRPFQALQQLSPPAEEAEFVNQMIRRTINYVYNAVLKAAVGKRV